MSALVWEHVACFGSIFRESLRELGNNGGMYGANKVSVKTWLCTDHIDKPGFVDHPVGADALRLHQNLNKPTNKPLEVVRKRSEMTMKIERCVRWYSDGVIAVKDG